MNAPGVVGILVMAAVLAVFRAGEAPAQRFACPVPPGNPDPGYGVLCEFAASSGREIVIDVTDFDIRTSTDAATAITGHHSGTNDIDIDVTGSSIVTRGTGSHGIYGWHQGTGDIDIDVTGSSIVTRGTGSHGIYGWHRGMGDIDIDVTGSSIVTRGRSSHGIAGLNAQTGKIDIEVTGSSIVTMAGTSDGILGYHTGNGTVRILVEDSTVSATGRGSFGINTRGSTRSTTLVDIRNSTVEGDEAGIRFQRGGWLLIGPGGTVRAASGIAVLADGTRLNLLVSLNPDGRRIEELLGGRVVNESGETTVVVNGVTLRDGAADATGALAPNGAWDVTMAESDASFSAADFIEVFASRAAVYEALPGVLLRLDDGTGGFVGKALRSPGSPLWVRAGGETGSFEAKRSTVGADYDWRRVSGEAGVDVRLGEGLAGSVGARTVLGEASVSASTGGGEVEAKGQGLTAGLSWRGANGFYGDGGVSATWYELDLSSSTRGRLRNDVDATVQSLDVEAGRRFALDGGSRLVARAWVSGARADVDDFTDVTGARVSADVDRLAVGAGGAAEADLSRGLTFRGSLGVERTLDGYGTDVPVSGETLSSESSENRVVLGVGAVWRLGAAAIHGAVRADGLGAGDKEYAGRLDLRVAF